MSALATFPALQLYAAQLFFSLLPLCAAYLAQLSLSQGNVIILWAFKTCMRKALQHNRSVGACLLVWDWDKWWGISLECWCCWVSIRGNNIGKFDPPNNGILYFYCLHASLFSALKYEPHLGSFSHPCSVPPCSKPVMVYCYCKNPSTDPPTPTTTAYTLTAPHPTETSKWAQHEAFMWTIALFYPAPRNPDTAPPPQPPFPFPLD